MSFLAPLAAGLLGAGTAAAGTAAATAGTATAAAGTAAAGTAAATGATAAAAGSGLSALSILQGGASVISALGALGAASTQAQALTAQATGADLQARAEDNSALQRQTGMKRALLDAIGENTVRTAAAGIDIGGGGLLDDMNASAETTVARELSIDRADRDFRKSMLRAQAAGYRSQARAVRSAGVLQAAGIGLTSGLNIFTR